MKLRAEQRGGTVQRLRDDPAGVLMQVVLCAMLGFALAGMPLAMLAIFRPVPVALGTLAVAALLWRLWSPAAVRRATPKAPALIAVAAIAAVTVVGAKYEAQHVIVEKDPGVYTVTGRWLAREGNLRVSSSQREFGYSPAARKTANGFYARSYHPDYVEPQFLHLLPALLAVGQWIGGLLLMFKVGALIGGLALLAVYMFATRLIGPWWAVGATLGLALSLPLAYFARDTYSEPLSLFFLFSGLWLLWDATETGSRRLHLLAGLALGATVMARVDALVYLIPLAAYLLLGPTLALPGRPAHAGWRTGLPLVLGLGVTTGLGLLDISIFAPGYLEDLPEVGVIGLALAGVVVLGGCAKALASILRPRRLSPRLKRLALAGIVLAAAVALALLDRNRPWLAWYLGTLTVVASLVGIALLAPIGRRREFDWRVAPFLLTFASVGALYLYRPSITIIHIWAMRRFLPVVIPGTLILAFVVVDRLWLSGRSRGLRALPRVAAVALAVLFVALPAAKLAPVASVAPQVPMGDTTEALCNSLPRNAAVVVTYSAARPWLVDTYPVTVRAFCGVPTVSVAADANVVRRLAVEQRQRGRRLYAISQDYVLPCLSAPSFGKFTAGMQELEVLGAGVPQQIVYTGVTFYLYPALADAGSAVRLRRCRLPPPGGSPSGTAHRSALRPG